MPRPAVTTVIGFVEPAAPVTIGLVGAAPVAVAEVVPLGAEMSYEERVCVSMGSDAMGWGRLPYQQYGQHHS